VVIPSGTETQLHKIAKNVKGIILVDGEMKYAASGEGKLIGIMGFAYHFIVNANGEVTSSHGDVYRVSCVGGK